jgi:arginyl-tRNA synthetase
MGGKGKDYESSYLAILSYFCIFIARKKYMAIVAHLKTTIIESVAHLYHYTITETNFQTNPTKPEFDGDYTVVLFSLLKALKKTPEMLGQQLGEHLLHTYPHLYLQYNVIKGFLNLTIQPHYLFQLLAANYSNPNYGKALPKQQRIVVEYSSPNTNKPLHLGHLRNNFLGFSIAEILKANGNDVIKTCIANDRGIHICKSMIAWQLFAKGATPASTGIKGDHFVGDYYVQFNHEYKKQIQQLIQIGHTQEAAEKQAPIMLAAQQMLIDWEANKPEVVALWKTMNSWVYKGFDTTYKKIGSDFDTTYFESETYLLGKKMVADGLAKGVFFQKEDGSVWIDLTTDGLDEKIVQRKDGTAVYITQDIGLAAEKYNAFAYNQSIYVVGDEQNYHFKVLQLICQKLNMPSSQGMYHLSYGMVELPHGRMKAREGTVVDADDIIEEMTKVAAQKTEELGKVKDFTPTQLTALYDTLALGALKFFLLRVDPKKRILFNPEESIDFQGFTGPFIQYTHARIKSILRKQAINTPHIISTDAALLPLEKELLLQIDMYSQTLQQAATEHNPSVIANYVFTLAKTFNSFYAEHSVANAETEEKKEIRLRICQIAAHIIASAMGLLGIKVPEQM